MTRVLVQESPERLDLVGQQAEGRQTGVEVPEGLGSFFARCVSRLGVPMYP